MNIAQPTIASWTATGSITTQYGVLNINTEYGGLISDSTRTVSYESALLMAQKQWAQWGFTAGASYGAW
jgi:hypothetical protein